MKSSMNFIWQFPARFDLDCLPQNTSAGYCLPTPAIRYWVRGWVRKSRWLVDSPPMGATRASSDLIAHLQSDDGCDRPYYHIPSVRVEHLREHTESGSIGYIQPSRPEPGYTGGAD